MCGIIGRVGKQNCVQFLLRGLEFLEYRGYDSAGIALLNDKISCCKAAGRLSELKLTLSNMCIEGNIGIGHTRWATHGKPDSINAHPHVSRDGKFALVHNGIIENSQTLLENELKGIAPISETDTEIIVLLLEKYYNGDVIDTVSRVTKLLKGSFALGILCLDTPNTLYAVAKESPLGVALCEGFSALFSDVGAVGEDCRQLFWLKNGEICVLEDDCAAFFDNDGKPIKKQSEEKKSDFFSMDKKGYEHFMLREIHEQSDAVAKTLKPFLRDGEIELNTIKLPKIFLEKDLQKIIISACGSAYYAATVGKYLFEKLCKIPCIVEIASELRYGNSIIDENTLAIFISQSGETADTLAALRLAKQQGAKTLSIVNVAGSVIANESDNVLYTAAGREVAVATTKAFSAQLSAIYSLAIFVAQKRGMSKISSDLITELRVLPQKIISTIELVDDPCKSLAKELMNAQHIYFLGRRIDLSAALEGALKMKEISYIHSEAYAAGELKHGTIALIEKGTPVISVALDDGIFPKTYSNLCEVASRGARIITVSKEKYRNDLAKLGDVITVPETALEFSVSLSVIPLQLLSYYTAYNRGCDIDKPKNLAKSVTVE